MAFAVDRYAAEEVVGEECDSYMWCVPLSSLNYICANKLPSHLPHSPSSGVCYRIATPTYYLRMFTQNLPLFPIMSSYPSKTRLVTITFELKAPFTRLLAHSPLALFPPTTPTKRYVSPPLHIRWHQYFVKERTVKRAPPNSTTRNFECGRVIHFLTVSRLSVSE